MAYILDQTYSFTIARLLEGFLRIDSLVVNGWAMIVGGVDQGITPYIHPGDSVNVDIIVSNQGELVDNFIIEVHKDGILYATSPAILNLGVYDPIVGGPTSSYSPATFVMPNANVALEIRTFHEE